MRSALPTDMSRTSTRYKALRALRAMQMADRPIVAFHQDTDGDWVAELECGHNQHVRHNPPWTSRPWVTSEEGRNAAIGQLLACRKCDQGAPMDEQPARLGSDRLQRRR